MQLILEKLIDDKVAQLKLDDKKILYIIYDGETLEAKGRETWKHMEIPEVREIYLEVYIEDYLRNKNKQDELQKAYEAVKGRFE